MLANNCLVLGEQLPSYGTGCECVNIIHFHQLGPDIRKDLRGKRWLLLNAAELPQATAALAFSELEDVLVGVDHRNAPVVEGLWSRAVHLLVVDTDVDPQAIQRASGITRVLASDEAIEALLW